MSTGNNGSMSTSYLAYAAILALAVIQVVVAMIASSSVGRMLILAGIQAYLAVMFFMHLRDEKPTLRIALIPATLFVLVMLNMVWADSFRLIHLRPFAK